MNKWFYIIIGIIFLFFTVSYAYLSQNLTIRGVTKTLKNTACNVSAINETSLDVKVDNIFYSETSGSIKLTITNNADVNYNFYTILLNYPDISIVNAYNGTYLIENNIMQIQAPEYQTGLSAGSYIEYFIQWTSAKGYDGLSKEDVVAFGNSNLSNYTGDNNTWLKNGNEIGSNPQIDFYLNNLSVDNYLLSPTFNSKIYNYTLTVPNNISSVNINASSNNIDAIIEGTGSFSLNEGINNVVVSTTYNNKTLNYNIKINRILNGVGANTNFGSDNYYAKYVIDYQSGELYQFTLTLYNNSSTDITSWEADLDLGEGSVDNIWSAINSSFNSETGILKLNYDVGNDITYKVIEANSKIEIKGQIKASYEPKIVSLLGE